MSPAVLSLVDVSLQNKGLHEGACAQSRYNYPDWIVIF